MNKMNVGVRKALSVVLMITVGGFFNLVTNIAFAQSSPKLVGYLSTKGQVTLNGISASSGAAIFGGSQLKTGTASLATISLGKMGQIDIEPESELTLRLDAGAIGGYLRSGRATISAPAGVAVNMATADGGAVADGQQASVLTVDVTSGNTRVASVRSEAKVTAGNRVEVVAAGQEVSVGAQANRQGNPCECFDRNGNKTGNGKYNANGVCECNSGSAAPVILAGSGGLTAGALAVLLIVGIGGAVGGIIAAAQSDGTAGSSGTVILSNFR
ncbi:MAG TPA: hypothetical protein VFZ34_17985 [Blastocatellia bacterium]|nr:hypothetical protein [Blastocatellia bacterium]